MATGESIEDLEEMLKAEEKEEGMGDEFFSDDESSSGDEDSEDEEDGSSEDEEGDDVDDNGEEDSDGEGEDDLDADEEDASEEDDEDDDEDDGEDDDDDEEVEDEGEENKEETKDKENKDIQFEDSDSGGEGVDSCPVCLSSLRRQDIGTPESCDHNFCLECIQEWAKNVNTCPVDRQVFHLILARHAGKEKIFKQFPVADKQQEDEIEEEDDPTYCEICSQSNNEDRLLLCDGCDHGYHCECLTPPLTHVPVCAWFCPECRAARGMTIAAYEPRQTRRQIGRTLISDRVRRLIQDARAERAERRRRVAAMIESEDEYEINLEEAGPSFEMSARSATVRQRKTPSQTRKRKTTKRKSTKRKTPRKRKTTKQSTKKKKTTRKKKTTKKGKGKGKGKKRKKTTKRRSTSSSLAAARTVQFPTPSSVKGRIADKLGLSKPPVGRSIPMQKVQSGANSAREGPNRAVDVGPATLSIRGNRDELYCFAETEGEERQIVNQPAISAEQLLSRSALLSHARISTTPPKRKLKVSSEPASSSSSGFDLLGSIMMNQDMLAKGSRHVTINRDGSLSAKNSDSSLSSPKKSSSGTASASPVKTENNTGSPSSATSISDGQSDIKDKKNKSPCSSKTTQNDRTQSRPSDKTSFNNNDVRSSKDISSWSDKTQTAVNDNNLDTEFDSDDELINSCLKAEGELMEKEGGMSHTEMNMKTKPMPSASGDADMVMEWEEESVRHCSHIQPSSFGIADSMTMEGVETIQNCIDQPEGGREEGEASDSDEEGEIRSDEEEERSNKSGDSGEEEGEIVEDEEKADDEVTASESRIDEIESTEIKPIKTEIVNTGNEDDESVSKCIEIKLEAPTDIQEDHKESGSPEKEKEEEEEEDDYDPNDPMNGSFQIARFLHSLVTNEFDRKKEADQRKEEEERKREEDERKREEEEKKKSEPEKDLSGHKISILDFIGNAGAMFGVCGDRHSSRAPGRGGRGRGTIRPFSFGRGRGSKDEDPQGGRGRGKWENSFPSKGNGFDGGEEGKENPNLHERPMRSGPRQDYHERRSRSHMSDSSEMSSSRSGRNVEERKRKREDFANRSMNGHSKRDRNSRREGARNKRRKVERRKERKVSKHHRRRSQESSESSSSSESGSESDGSSSSSDGSLIKLSEPCAMPTTPSDSPCPTPPSAPPPPPPPPPPIPGQSQSPEPPPPPHLGPHHGHIPSSGVSPGRPSAHTHPGYSHQGNAHHIPGQAQGVKCHSESSYAPTSGQAPPGQPHAPAVYPQAYHHSSQQHHAPPSSQNPPATVSHPAGHHPPPTAGAYHPSAHPTTAYPYYPRPHSHPSHPSSYYPSASLPNGQQRPGAPVASTHSGAATYPPRYPSQHPSSGYPTTASAVRHPQQYPAAYPPGHVQRPATSHPYYPAHTSSHRPAAPQPQAYSYPQRHPYPASTTVSASSHPSHAQASARPPHPQYSVSATRPHPSGMARPEPSSSVRQHDAAYFHSQRHMRPVKESPQKTSPKPEVKSTRLIYRPSPPTVRGVATSDRVASIMLHDEVKKGFRQLVEDAVRSALKPAWGAKRLSKESYKDIFKKCVEKVCGSKETVVQQDKIQSLVDAYVVKARKARS